MRSVHLVAVMVLAALLSGCSGGGDPDTQQAPVDDFGVAPAAPDKGVLLGVVVDETITPIRDVQVQVALPSGQPKQDKTDDKGQFAFGDLDPGVYIVEARHPSYLTVSSPIEVVANDPDPRINRIQLTRLFDQDPYTEMVSYDGYIACAYSFFVSSTCVNDYTRVLPLCPGGCFRDQELAKQGGNLREYVSTVGPGWQSIIFEETWDSTSALGENLGFTVSYFSRPNAGHWFGSVDGQNPLRLQLDVGVEHESLQYSDGEPTTVPANGTEELFTFFGAGDGSLALNQAFRSFQTVYYYGIPEEGWSFVAGDPRPY